MQEEEDTNITYDQIISRKILSAIDCFKFIENINSCEDNAGMYVCCIQGCTKSYLDKSAASRHLRKKHVEIYTNIHELKKSVGQKSLPNVSKLNIIMDRNELVNACVDLITRHSLPLSFVEFPAFRKILDPYIAALKEQNIRLSIDRESIKDHIAHKANVVKQTIMHEVKHKMICLMIDIASRYNRSILGINIRFVCYGKVCVRTIGMHVLLSSHTAAYIVSMVKQNLLEFQINLEQILSVTTDNGRNIIKSVTLLDELYQHEIHQNLISGTEDDLDNEEFDDINLDQNEHDVLLFRVQQSLSNIQPSDLIHNVSCAAHCLHLVVKHGIENCESAKNIIAKSRNLAKKLRTPTYRNKLKEANYNMALIDVETRWNSIYKMV